MMSVHSLSSLQYVLDQVLPFENLNRVLFLVNRVEKAKHGFGMKPPRATA